MFCFGLAPKTENQAQYLARHDLVSTSLYKFDDKPENYLAWQSSFTNATTVLGLTSTEMLDLLLKWLGVRQAHQKYLLCACRKPRCSTTKGLGPPQRVLSCT